jgi:hypothetical protein
MTLCFCVPSTIATAHAPSLETIASPFGFRCQPPLITNPSFCGTTINSSAVHVAGSVLRRWRGHNLEFNETPPLLSLPPLPVVDAAENTSEFQETLSDIVHEEPIENLNVTQMPSRNSPYTTDASPTARMEVKSQVRHKIQNKCPR